MEPPTLLVQAVALKDIPKYTFQTRLEAHSAWIKGSNCGWLMPKSWGVNSNRNEYVNIWANERSKKIPKHSLSRTKPLLLAFVLLLFKVFFLLWSTPINQSDFAIWFKLNMLPVKLLTSLKSNYWLESKNSNKWLSEHQW